MENNNVSEEFKNFSKRNECLRNSFFEFLELNDVDLKEGIFTMSEIISVALVKSSKDKELIDDFFDKWKKLTDHLWKERRAD